MSLEVVGSQPPSAPSTHEKFRTTRIAELNDRRRAHHDDQRHSGARVGIGAGTTRHEGSAKRSKSSVEGLANPPASPNSPFGQKIWTKPIDGRTSPELERAIILFQSNNRITQSGRIDPMGPDIQTLDRTLPPDRKGIAAVENRTAVLFTSINVSAMTQAQEALRKRTLLPGPAAEQLGDVVRNIQKQMGLVPRPDGHGIDQQGRMIQKLAFADTHWMNTSGQFTAQIPMDKARQVVSALLRRPPPSLLEWHTGPMPFGHAPVHQVRRAGNRIGASGGGMGNVVLAVPRAFDLSQARWRSPSSRMSSNRFRESRTAPCSYS